MKKKTLGQLKHVYAAVTGLPGIKQGIGVYQKAKTDRRAGKYKKHLEHLYTKKTPMLADTDFCEVILPGEPQRYPFSFDIGGYICADAADFLFHLPEEEPSDIRIAISEEAIPPRGNVYILSGSQSYFFTKNGFSAAFVGAVLDETCLDPEKHTLKIPAGLKRDLHYAKERADFTAVYLIDRTGLAPAKVLRTFANTGVHRVFRTDGTTLCAGPRSVKRKDGQHVPTFESTGVCSDGQNGILLHSSVIPVPQLAEYDYNEWYLPFRGDNGTPCILKDPEDPHYRDVVTAMGSFRTKDRMLTVGGLCEAVQAALPAEYGYLKDVTVDTIRTHWQDMHRGDVFFFNEPYNDVNDVYEKPLSIQLLMVKKALARGCIFVFSYVPLDPAIPHVVLDSPMESHIALCAKLRQAYPLRTVGITGSIGKTSTKDMLYLVLSEQFITNKNLRNTNTQVHIGLHIQDFKEWQEIFIQEIAGGRVGGASRHSRMVLPEAAVVTNIGDAHIGNHGSREALMRNKLGIRDGLIEDGILYLNGDDPLLSQIRDDDRIRFFAIDNHDADYYADNIVQTGGTTSFEIVSGEHRVPVTLHVLGNHNVLNAVCCYAIARQFGMQDEQIVRGLAKFHTAGVRQNLITISDIDLYVDCFNASSESVSSALDTLDSYDAKGRKIAVLGDVTGGAQLTDQTHQKIGAMLPQHKIDILFCYGPKSKIVYQAAQEAGIRAYHITKPAELEKHLRETMQPGDFVLFKGSSKMKMAEVIDDLFGTMLSEQMYTDTIKIKEMEEGDVHYRVCPSFATAESCSPALTTVSLPAEVGHKKLYNIAEQAFSGHPSLRRIALHGVRHIGAGAFEHCAKLEEVTETEHLRYIAEGAFRGCTALRKLHLGSQITQIEDNAFEGCEALLVVCPADSVAARYCEAHGIPCTVE